MAPATSRAFCTALAVLFFGLWLLPEDAEARRRRRKGRAARRPSVPVARYAHPDRDLVLAMQRRDRGELDAALDQVRRLVLANAEDVAAHRLYQELAALSRRDGALVEAEYRHLRATQDDALRALLWASASLTRELTADERLYPIHDRIEHALAVAETDRRWLADVHLVAADLARVRGDGTEVRARLEEAYAADPRNPTVRSELLTVLVRAGRPAEAAVLAQKLLDDTPWRARALASLLGEGVGGPPVPLDIGAPLLKRLDSIQRDRSRDVVTLQAILSAYEAAGLADRAEACRTALRIADARWRPPLQRSPYLPAPPGGEWTAEEDAAVEMIRAALAHDGEDPKAALATLVRIEPALPEHPRVRRLLELSRAELLRTPEVGDLSGGRAAYARAMVLDPEDPHAANAWAYCNATDGVDLAEGLATIDRALSTLLGRRFDPLTLPVGGDFAILENEQASTTGAFFDTRGWLLHRLGRHAEAVESLQLAALLVDDGTVQGHLGLARLAQGEREGAFVALLRALVLGTDEEESVRAAAEDLYELLHVVPGGLSALVAQGRAAMGREASETEVVSPPSPDE